MSVAELHDAAAESSAWRLRAAEEEKKEADVASMMSASTADLAGEHVKFSLSESTVDFEFGRSCSTAPSRLSDLEQSLPDFEKTVTADAGHGEQEARRQRIAERRARLREMLCDMTPSELYGTTPSEHVPGLCGTDCVACKMQQRRAERRARLREKYGKAPSEHELGFCSSDCTACRKASVSPAQTIAAPTAQMNCRPAVSDADTKYSMSQSTLDSAKSASTADFDCEPSHRTPASPLFDLERLASAVYV